MASDLISFAELTTKELFPHSGRIRLSLLLVLIFARTADERNLRSSYAAQATKLLLSFHDIVSGQF